MNEARFQVDELPTDRSRSPAADDLLPPVEPPSAGFIIQLFVVPALIVLVILGVWLTFNSLVRRSSPDKILQGLEYGPSIARWQRASELANMLRNERFAEFKRSPEAAEHVARILDREIDHASSGGGMREEDVTLRYFLARALGEFEVTEGIDVLLNAAETNRDSSEQLVRHGALEAIAVRAYNLQRLEPPRQLAHEEVEPTLFRLAGDENPQIRSDTAFALGKIGTPASMERLEMMVDDPDPDTRYNAAIALAHRGNTEAAETLAEMLDLEESAGVRNETSDHSRAFKRAVIVASAMEAAQELARKNANADLSLVTEALEQIADAGPSKLAKAQLPRRVVSDARRALGVLRSEGSIAVPNP